MVGNYTFVDLENRIEASKKKHAVYIDGLLARYVDRQAERKRLGMPVVAFLGYGRAGKDTSAEFVCAHTKAVYPGSASQLVLPVIADVIGVCENVAWNERHQHREFWIKACHLFRGRDYSLLVRMCLGAGDVVVGVRGRLELEACCHDKVVDWTWWIDNYRVSADITVEYGPGDCDLVVPNHGGFLELYSRLRRHVSFTYPAEVVSH